MQVKICGITHSEDAHEAGIAGADYIGMILSEGYKRSVPLPLAKEIAAAATRAGATPVGVFTGGAPEEILRIARQIDLNAVELHGIEDLTLLQMNLKEIICSVGEKLFPEDILHLYEGGSRGTGKHFHWSNFAPPENRKWILGGGLSVENISEAIKILKPHMVTVSSSLDIPGSTRKEIRGMNLFIRKAKMEAI